MPVGRIDREAWAREVESLIARFDPGSRWPGNKSAFARRIGYTTRTVDRWIAQDTDVKIETVHSVIDALKLDAQEGADLLARIGFRIGVVQPPAPVDPRKDKVIRMILDDPQWTEEEREALVEREIERMRREQERRIEDYVLYLRQQREERGERGTA